MVKMGYRQTEIGTIPVDWEVEELVGVSSQPMQNGVFFKPSQKGRGVKLINVGDLYTNIPIDVTSLELFDASEDEKKRFHVLNGDLFFTRSSVVASGIAHCNIYKNSTNEIVLFDSHVIRVRPDSKVIYPSFLYRYCVSRTARKYLVAHAKTGTMTTIDQGVMAKLPIPLPPLPEQQAIAEALSDVDALIKALDRLIAKKRDVKQGAMQALLTGKTRLPGFSGDWESRRLGDLFEITSSKRVFQSEWKTEGIPFYRAREMAVLGEKGYVKNELFISEEMYDAYKNIYGIPKIGDLLVTGVGTLGKVYVVSDDQKFYFKDGNIIWFKILGKVNSDFLKQLYLTPLVIKQIDDASAGTTVGTYTISAAKKTAIPYPSLPEQQAIAQILSDMDAEIEALEQKRDKYKAIKQGMMQELLTGKTRLL